MNHSPLATILNTALLLHIPSDDSATAHLVRPSLFLAPFVPRFPVYRCLFVEVLLDRLAEQVP